MPIKPATAKTDHTHDLDLDERRSRIALNRAQQVQALWATPIMADPEIPIALRIPSSTWQLRKKLADAPPIFSIGKRSYVRTAELLAWCERLNFVPKRPHRLPYPRAARQEAQEINV